MKVKLHYTIDEKKYFEVIEGDIQDEVDRLVEEMIYDIGLDKNIHKIRVTKIKEKK